MNIVYSIINTVNGKKYIGITSRTLAKRWAQHCKCSRNPKVKLHRAIKKYGKDSFMIEMLNTYDTWEEAVEWEKFFIEFYDTFKYGYNMTLGGDGSYGVEPWNKNKKTPYAAEAQKRSWKDNREHRLATHYRKPVTLEGKMYPSMKSAKEDGWAESTIYWRLKNPNKVTRQRRTYRPQ